MPIDDIIVSGLFAVVYGAAGINVFRLAVGFARERDTSLNRQPEWLPINIKWIGIGVVVLFGLFWLFLSGRCLLALFRLF